MLVGKVTGRFVATRKHDKLIGCKFLVCDLIGQQSHTMNKVVAVDCVGAGVGDHVLIVLGQAARLCEMDTSKPVDASIVGILDDENKMDVLE